MQQLAPNVQRMPRQGIRDIMRLAASMTDVLHLEVGEPNFATPAHITAGALRAAEEGFTHYTANTGLLSLRQKLVDKLARFNGVHATPDCIVVTPGAVCALATTICALTGPGDEILIPDPAWPNYEMNVVLYHGVPKRYTLAAANGFLPDLDEIEAAITSRTRALLINTPGSPGGAVFPSRLVRDLVELARRHDLYLVSDEIYEEIIFEGEHVSALSFDVDGRVIGIYGFSKAYAMTGWRIGYAVASPRVAEVLGRLQEPLVSCTSAVSQKAAEAALDGPQDCVAAMRAEYRHRRDVSTSLLSDLGVHYHRPAGTFYLMVDISSAGMDSTTFARTLLQEAHVAVAPGETFGPSARNLVRISLASAEDELVEGLQRLARFLHSRASVPVPVPVTAR